MNWPWLRAGRACLVGAIAGFPVGLLTLGVGSRLAMRVAAITAPAAAQGRETEAGAIVGTFTGGGTGFLVGAGAMIGVALGVLYMALRRWMPHRGVIYGIFLMCVASSRIINSENRDFEILGSPVLNIAMFVVLGLLFGLAFVPLAERLDARLKRPPVGIFGAIVYTLPLLVVVPALMSLGSGEIEGVAIVGALIAVVLVRILAPRVVASPVLDRVMQVVLVAAAALGAVRLVIETAQILI